MSIFETHVKDVAERTDSDPLELSVKYTKVESQDDLDSQNDANDGGTVDALPGEVILVNNSEVLDEGSDSPVTVNLPDPAARNTKVTVKKLDQGSSDGTNSDTTVSVSDDFDGELVDTDQILDTQYSTVTLLSDGTDYYVV